MHCCKKLLNMSNILFRVCISGGVYVPCTYTYARWELPYWGLLYVIKRMYLWRSLCTLYLHACQVRVTVLRSSLCYLRECISGGVYVPCTYTHARWELPYWGDSGLCCCVCVTSFDFERYCLLPCVLTTLCSAKVKRLGEIQITFDSFNPNSKILAKLGFRLYQCPRRSRQ